MTGKLCHGKRHTPMELAYLAGIIDGEGYIGIDSCYKRKGRQSTHQLRVGVVNTSPELIMWLKETFGGSWSKREKPMSEKHSQCYQWRAEAKIAENILRLVVPFLIIKCEQVRVALMFRETFTTDNLIFEHENHRFKGTVVKGEIIELRKELRSQMLELNRRGPKGEIHDRQIVFG
jgi:hypothetical protein